MNMEITELMIGDIVQYLDGKKLITVVVVKVDGSGNVVRLKQKNGHKFNTTIDFLKPIPLTPEILESNGFEQGTIYENAFVFEDENEHQILVYLKDRNYTRGGYTYIDAHCGCLDISEMPVNDVHILQHALRLCEIDKQISLP